MLYALTHYLKDKVPWLWEMIERCNSAVFSMQHRRGLKVIPSLLKKHTRGLSIVEVAESDAAALARFFAEQPDEAFNFFHPHEFDEMTLQKLIRLKSFLMFLVKDGERIVGYFFLRCFVGGKAFLGKMVDVNAQGQGIGKTMCRCAMDVASALGLRMFETISKDNLASLYSTQRVLKVRIVKEMPNGYLYIEDLRKKSDSVIINRGGYVVDCQCAVMIMPQEGLPYAA